MIREDIDWCGEFATVISVSPANIVEKNQSQVVSVSVKQDLDTAKTVQKKSPRQYPKVNLDEIQKQPIF